MNTSITDLPTPAVAMIEAATSAGGAVLVYAPDDRVLWVNDAQARLIPCDDYGSETYSSLFWRIIHGGLTKDQAILSDPAAWVARMAVIRRQNRMLQWIGSYEHGRMAASHLCLDDGTCVQARVSLPSIGVDRYFSDVDGGAGLTEAIRLQKMLLGLQSALDALDLAIALVDRDGRIMHRNASFAELLDRRDGLLLGNDGRLSTAPGVEFSRQIIAAADAGIAGAVPLPRRSAAPLLAALAPGGLAGTAIVAISRFGEDTETVASALQRVFGLYPVESEIAALIGAGHSPADIGERRGTSAKTIYNQINKIKSRLRASKISANDTTGIAGLVGKIAEVSRIITKHN